MQVNCSHQLLRIALREQVQVFTVSGHIVTGTLTQYDEFVNMSLSDVTLVDPAGHAESAPLLFIRGDSIKYFTKLEP